MKAAAGAISEAADSLALLLARKALAESGLEGEGAPAISHLQDLLMPQGTLQHPLESKGTGGAWLSSHCKAAGLDFAAVHTDESHGQGWL